MTGKNVEDYLIKGIYGEKQIKIEERNIFLGTIRERVEIALTTSQVMANSIYPIVEKSLSLKNVNLLLNGTLPYNSISKYILLAKKINIPFSLVNNLPTPTPIGLVIAHQNAVDKNEIFTKDELYHSTEF
ncbi:YueI family protein [Gottfriedia luciferensis]|uniref:YueI family protein n=1 Tax=Gottfriedia luciferensis TaxID=178774 RepID=UPI000B4408FA|nr:YueI family protein [Gottfriedia luciferensis]